MHRFFISALVSLACLSTLPALAQAGSTQADVTLSVDANPTASGVSLTGTVLPPMPGTATAMPHPGGTVTFFDGTTPLNAGGTALAADTNLSIQTFEQVFGGPYAGFPLPEGVLTGDFNGDGKPDLVVYGGGLDNSLLLQVFLSGQESYHPLAPQIVGLLQYEAPFAIDVNGDGKLDLLEGDTVLYGNGDGTFANTQELAFVGTDFWQVYVADINGDGKPDIIKVELPYFPPTHTITSPVQYLFTVFRNDGAGKFTSLGSFPLAAPIPPGSYASFGLFGLSFADLNGDGKLDMISQSNAVPSGDTASAVNLSTLLNNGDGTFGPPHLVENNTTSSVNAIGTAFGDVNGDGKADMVLAHAGKGGGNYVALYPGNGDGTFADAKTLLLDLPLSSGAALQTVVLTDLNLDGHLEAVTGTGAVALGDGNGGLSLSDPLFPEVGSPSAVQGYPLLLFTLAGKSLPSLIFANRPANSNAVFTPKDSSSASTTVALSAGTHTLTAHYSGDGTYAPGDSSPVTITVAPAAPPTITLASSANPIYVSQSVTFTATLSDPAITGSITFLDISKNDDNPLDPMAGTTESTLGTGTIANGVATLTTTLPVGGVHTILAVYGSDIYAPIAQGQLTETVNVPFSVAASANAIPIPLTAASGKSVSTQLSISALGGFAGPVTFGCADFAGVCSFSPATANVAGTSATAVTLTVTATPAPTTAEISPISSGTILACGVPLFALFGIASVGRRRALFGVIAIVLCGVSCLGCGGGGGGGGGQQPSSASLPAGTYPFYVTATSGQNELAINAVLTVP